MKEKNMRQAGLKPKSHNSGIYWMRASDAAGEMKKGSKSNNTNNDPTPLAQVVGWLAIVPIFVLVFPFVYIFELIKAHSIIRKK